MMTNVWSLHMLGAGERTPNIGDDGGSVYAICVDEASAIRLLSDKFPGFELLKETPSNNGMWLTLVIRHDTVMGDKDVTTFALIERPLFGN